MDIFNQLLEMDDEEDREFSKSIVWNYFDQAESTFGNMDDALWVLLRISVEMGEEKVEWRVAAIRRRDREGVEDEGEEARRQRTENLSLFSK